MKFTEVGSVGLTAWTEAGRLAIEVQDTGVGISERDLQFLFLPFRQIDSGTTRSQGGSGLGLAISKRLSELMGGSLVVTSKVGSGTTFTLTVPFSDPLSASNSAEELTRLRLAGTDKKKILVAEDNLTNQKILTRLLTKAGYQCDVVENGLAAVEAATRFGYDLVLMDCHMPEMDGYDATRRIIESLGDKAPPIVAVTANATNEGKKHCQDAGMVDFLSKPVRLAPLQTVLDSFLG